MTVLDQVAPWKEWLAVVKPHDCHNTRGRPAVGGGDGTVNVPGVVLAQLVRRGDRGHGV